MTVDELFEIGYNYYCGDNGYPIDYERAYKYFLQASDLGSSVAMNALGVMYQNGEGVTQNLIEAFNWYVRAVEADDDNYYALHNLGCMYYYGTYVNKDMRKAFQYLEKSILLGVGNTHTLYPESCFLAGLIMLEYYKNNARAFHYFSEAAKYGDIPDAWHNMGYLCEKGVLNIPVDEIPTVALKYYLNAANLGCADAMDAVGKIYYLMGEYDKTRYWLKKGAALGSQAAKKRLKAFEIARGGSLWNLFK